MSMFNFMFIAGDPSGDQNSGPLIAQLYKEYPQCKCYGIGGPQMEAQGFKPLLPFDRFNRMGYLEVLFHLPFFLKAKNMLIEEMKRHKPNILICVDYSGFNIPIMKEAHALKIPVLWYIIPKFWARRNKNNRDALINYASSIATIFPFERDLLLPYKKETYFVGNPLVEFIETKNLKFNPSEKNLQQAQTINLALVPGSRLHEINNVLPVMISALQKLKERYPNISTTISKCTHISSKIYENLIKDRDFNSFEGPLEELFYNSDLAIVTSGTATLQTALSGVPMVIVYKISSLSFNLFKYFIADKIKYVGLPNIIANESIVPELLQDKMTSQSIADAVIKYIESYNNYSETKNKLLSLRNNLGSKKPSIEMLKLISKLLT